MPSDGLTVGQLIKYLETLPKDAKIYYADMNYGHPEEEFTEYDFRFVLDYLPIDSILWETCD